MIGPDARCVTVLILRAQGSPPVVWNAIQPGLLSPCTPCRIQMPLTMGLQPKQIFIIARSAMVNPGPYDSTAALLLRDVRQLDATRRQAPIPYDGREARMILLTTGQVTATPAGRASPAASVTILQRAAQHPIQVRPVATVLSSGMPTIFCRGATRMVLLRRMPFRLQIRRSCMARRPKPI